MAENKLLSSTPSRRGVLATGVKVAYATPLVLATMKAAPVFAQDIQADLSEDEKTEPALEGQLNSITATITSIALGQGGSLSTSVVDQAASALTAFNNDYQAIVTQVKAIVPGTTPLGSALVGGNYTLPTLVAGSLPGAISGGILKTTNTVDDAVATYNSYEAALATAISNLAANLTSSTAQATFATASANFQKVEDTVETALLNLAGSTP